MNIVVYIFYGELSRHKTAKRRYTLLPIKNFKTAVACTVKIYQSYRITFQQRINNSNVVFSVIVNIMTLIFGLNGKSAVKPEQSFSFQLVVCKPFANISNSPFRM